VLCGSLTAPAGCPATDCATPPAYTARVTIWRTSGWAIGNTGNAFRKVCRYTANYNRNGEVFWSRGVRITNFDNPEHPYAYLNVRGSLSHQNFLIIDAHRDCPIDIPTHAGGPAGENRVEHSTVIQQP